MWISSSLMYVTFESLLIVVVQIEYKVLMQIDISDGEDNSSVSCRNHDVQNLRVYYLLDGVVDFQCWTESGNLYPLLGLLKRLSV